MSLIAERMVEAPPQRASESALVSTLRLETSVVPGAEWDRIVSQFDDICQEQLHAFARARWPQVPLEPTLFSYHGQIVGGALVMVKTLPLGLGGIAICKWGPMLADARRPDRKAIYAAIVEALVQDYAHERRMMLSILPWTRTERVNADFQYLLGRGFRAGSKLLFPNRYLINLRLSDAEQRASLQQKWRYHLHKAEQGELTFETAGPQGLPAFHALYAEMLQRKHFEDHSAYETVEPLMAMGEGERPELFIVRHAGEVVASAMIFKNGDRAVYLYGATSDRALALRAGYFMHWHIIRWLRDHTNASWYDLGGTDGFQGLHQFKKGMVGEAGVIRPVPRVANYAANPLSYLIGVSAFTLRDHLNCVRRYVHNLSGKRARPDQPPHVEDVL